jgi:hypothetical protein
LPGAAVTTAILWRYYGPAGVVTQAAPLISTLPEAP